MAKTAQKSEPKPLYGGSVSGEFTTPETRFVKVWEEVKEIGDTLVLKIDGAALNAERGCLTIFDNNDETETVAMTMFFEHHSDAQYKDGPTDAARFGNAVARGLGTQIASNDELGALCAEGGLVLTVSGTDYNGGFSRLWTVTRA